MVNSDLASKTTLGVLIGSRGFFPEELVKQGRKTILSKLTEMGFSTVTLDENATDKFGAVETHEDAKIAANHFQDYKGEIDGVLITLPNFGDEKAVAETLRIADLNVPILVHAFPDSLNKMGIEHRRDSFCGKLSVCNNLNQYGIPFSLTSSHVESPGKSTFREDLKAFSSTCKVVNGLRSARIGAIGARVGDFNTVRYSEKILERQGISIETVDLSEIIDSADRLKSSSNTVQNKVAAIKDYIPTEGVSKNQLAKIAKLALVINQWIEKKELDAVTVQCWSALEELYGVVPCTAMSMLSESLTPAACEVDVMGAISMYALQLASGQPSALTDFNNNYGEKENKLLAFHCSNFPISFFENPSMGYQKILADDVGKQNSYGTCVGKIAPGPATFLRLSTSDNEGRINSFLAKGKFTEDTLDTFGGYGVAKIEGLQKLLKFACKNGFEHHVAVTKSHIAEAIEEALTTYLEWELFYLNS